jgi:hypothetical protein
MMTAMRIPTKTMPITMISDMPNISLYNPRLLQAPVKQRLPLATLQLH